MRDYKFKTIFASKILPIDNENSQKVISLASKNTNIGKLLPKNVDLKNNIGFLPFIGESFVANVLNANNDGVKTEEAIKIAQGFPLTYIDVNHKRDRLCGVVVDAFYTDYKTGKELSENDIKLSKNPFAVSILGIVWKAPNPELAETIENMNSSDSELKDSIYLSWELAFDENELIVMNPKDYNFINGEFITNENDIKLLSKRLVSNGGNGFTEDGKKIGRVAIGDVVVLGVGLVENPAAAVSPIVIEDTKESTASINLSESLVEKLKLLPESGMGYQICDIEMADNSIIKNISIHNCSILSKSLNINDIKDIKLSFAMEGIVKTEPILVSDNNISTIDSRLNTIITISENNISQANIVDVKKNNDISDNTKLNMKIEKFEQITPENLKEIKLEDLKEIYASSSQEMLQDGIRKINEDYKAKLSEKDIAIKATQDASAELQKTVKELETKLSKASDELTKIANENKQRETLAAFSSRMSTIDDIFELDDKQKEIVANKVKTLSSDEDFTKYLEEIDILLAAKKKDKKKNETTNKDNSKDNNKDDDKSKNMNASIDTRTIEDALKNGKKDNTDLVPNTATIAETLTEKGKRVFGMEGWVFNDKRKNRI